MPDSSQRTPPRTVQRTLLAERLRSARWLGWESPDHAAGTMAQATPVRSWSWIWSWRPRRARVAG